MTEHYTRNTESVTAWCNKCQRETRHIVSSGRRGHCLEHERSGKSKRQEREERKRREAEQNPPLEFDRK
jgi:hypothetical protein